MRINSCSRRVDWCAASTRTELAACRRQRSLLNLAGRPMAHSCASWEAGFCVNVPVDPVGIISLRICAQNIDQVHCGDTNMRVRINTKLSIGLAAYVHVCSSKSYRPPMVCRDSSLLPMFVPHL